MAINQINEKNKHVSISNYGKTYIHSHDSTDGHSHKHIHQNTKAVLNRLAKAKGHLDSVRRMIESDRDCSEVLIQLAAVISALTSTGKVILQEHIEHCLVEAVESGDKKAIEDLNKAINLFIK